LAENYFQLNDLNNYAKYDKLYKKALEDFNQSEINSVGEITQNLTLEKKENNLPDKNENFIFIILGVVLLVIAVFFFLRSYFLRKKMK